MTTLRRCTLLAATALFAAIAAGCAQTRIINEWKDESLARVPFSKVLAVFQTPDSGLRRILEDEMARDIPHATPSYKVLRDDEIRDVERAKARVNELGFDTMVVMRVTSVDREKTYVPGMRWIVPATYLTPWGYWTYGWSEVYEPGYLRTDRIVRIATNIYSLPDDKLVFSSESETLDPASLRNAVADVVKLVAKETDHAVRAHA
jgi:hypothetical protein